MVIVLGIKGGSGKSHFMVASFCCCWRGEKGDKTETGKRSPLDLQLDTVPVGIAFFNGVWTAGVGYHISTEYTL